MEIKGEVVAEDSRTSDNVEYCSITLRELSPKPLLQFFDYGLKQDEKALKGKLIGQTVILHVTTIRDVFSGRPQMTGTMELVKK